MLVPSITQETDYSIFSKPECIFAAIWHNPEGTVSTEAIAQYYQVEAEYIDGIVERHHQEFEDLELNDDGWTPRGAIRLGLLLVSPIATAVRSLALDVIEAYKQSSKKTSIKYLLENTQFVEWSNREIGRILECSPTTVGEMRKKLENDGNILQFKKRKHLQGGKEVERNNEDLNSQEMSTTGHLSTSNPDSSVAKVKVCLQSHDRFGQEGVIVKENPGHWQKLIRFDDGEEVAIADTDLDASSVPFTPVAPIERRHAALPKTYTEEELQREVTRAIAESRIGMKVEIEEAALSQVQEQLTASQKLASDKAKEVAKLQQMVEELESLRLLESENQQLQQRIGELERALEKRPVQEWANTLTRQAAKTINANTIKIVESLEPELHLRALAVSPPTDVEECLHLMSMALANLGKSLNSTSALSYAAAMLRCSPTPEAIALQSERNLMSYQAVEDIRSSIEQGCNWGELKAKADEYVEIKQEYWALLTMDERSLINKLKKDFDSARDLSIKPQLRVTHSDEFNKLSQIQGTVLKIESGKFIVHWDDCDRPLFQHRYEEDELKLVE